MERVLVRVHVKRVDREVIRSETERLKDLCERQLLVVAEDDDVLLVEVRNYKYTKRVAARAGRERTSGQRFIFDFMNRRRCF